MLFRPLWIWSLFSLCALLVLGAMLALTRHAIQMEHASQVAASDAELAERTRLALWRMDTEAASLLAVENNRPAVQFQALYSPNSAATVRIPSPLLREIPQYARLYFEVTPQGHWSSPQIPPSEELTAALENGAAPDRIREFRERLENLQTSIPLPDLLSLWKSPATPLAASPDFPSAREEAKSSASELPETNAVLTKSAALLNADQAKRASVVNRAVTQGELAQNVVALESSKTRARAASPKSKTEIEPAAPAREEPSPATLPRVSQPTPSADLSPRMSSYESAWLHGHLILWREAFDGNSSRLQGIWLDADALSRSLRNSISDILPQAQLARSSEAGPLSLVTLPYTLIPGTLPADFVPIRLSGSIRNILILAWIAALCALGVAAALLAGVVALGERRAAFVSSVTHELRTPLTTFRMYSEMLADNMVPDPENRHKYLQTLQREAGRLSHLVENVLSYSKVERGSARTHRESLTVESLLQRFEPRLRERAAQAGLTFRVQMTPETQQHSITTDPTAVEQILFNLTDNAGKYTAQSTPPQLELSIFVAGNTVRFSLRDYGPGIPRKERARLFRPFHKSASEAAHTQPGIGLGLALSRRLAKAMGGSLTLRACSPGCQFDLVLPSRYASKI